MDLVKELEKFAVAHYEQGGHWIVERWESADYQALLRENSNDVELAQAALKREWELTNEQERNCAWGAPEELY